MSLNAAFFAKNGILVCGDTRVSYDKDNIIYYVEDGSKKLHHFGDKVVFIGGSYYSGHCLASKINDDDSIKTIFDKYKTEFELNKDALILSREKSIFDDLVVNIYTIENMIPVFYQMVHINDYELTRKEVPETDIYIGGFHCQEAGNYFSQRMKKANNDSIENLILETFEFVADERVGGEMVSYYIYPDMIKKGENIKIKDHKNLNRIVFIDDENIHAEKLGYDSTAPGFWMGEDNNKWKFKIGNSTDYMDWDGDNLVFSENVRIQFKGDKGDTGATGPQGVPGSYYAPYYLESTCITSTEIQSPTITGNTGRFSGEIAVGSGNNLAGINGIGTSDSSIRFWAGSSDKNNAPFRVTQDGSIVADDADITGKFILKSNDKNSLKIIPLNEESAGYEGGAFL